MAKVRQDVVDQQLSSFEPYSGNRNERMTSSFDWAQIDANLEIAEHHADVGTKILPLLRFHRAIRWFAKGVSRIVLYVSRIVTIPQMHFNRAILMALRILRNGTREMEIKLYSRMYAFEQRNEKEAVEKFKQVNEKFIERDREISCLKDKLNQLKTISILQERRISTLLEEARRRMPDRMDSEQLQTFSNEAARMLDPLYLFFEDEFRGTRTEIKNSQKIYLPILKNAHAGSAERPVLDIGCGRGEWLELLKEESFAAIGVDMNRLLVERNISQGLDVIEGDAISYLSGIRDSSLGAMTAFHLIEHLNFDSLICLLDETVRVLKPGGVAIFETPNPENMLVGACHFYSDPTHRNPLPIPTMKFLAEHRGLCRVEFLRLHPFPEGYKMKGSELAERFNEYFYGPRDYAIIGYRA